MGRNLLKAPLRVLLAQVEDNRLHLAAVTPVREAMIARGVDVADLDAALAQEIHTARAALLAWNLAEGRLRAGYTDQHRVNEAFRTEVEQLRARLSQPLGPERRKAAAAVRAHLPRHAGLRFAATLASLRSLGVELDTRAEILGPEVCTPDLRARTSALRARAELAARALDSLVERRRIARQAAVAAQTSLRAALLRLRAAWRLGRTLDPTLPPLPAAQLEAYAHRPTADPDAAAEVPSAAPESRESARSVSETT